MKLAYLVCSFPPYHGGMGNSALQLALAVAQHQHQVSVFTPDYGNDRLQDSNQPPSFEGIEVFRLKPWLNYGNAAWLPQLTKRLLKYDIIHLHYPFYGAVLAVLLVKLFKPKVKLIIHYHMDTKAPGFKGLIFKVYRYGFFPLIFQVADFVTCASLDYIKHSDIATYANRHIRKFAQIPFGVDLNRFQRGAAPSTNHQLLFVGGLDEAHYFKGVEVLIDALALVNTKERDWNLKIVGRGNLKDSYESYARSLGLETQISFIDDADNESLAQLYQNSRCLILPSINRNEAFGLVLLEAMATGRPVIASNLPGVRNVFRNGQDGYLVKPGQARDLADKILKILQHDELCDRLGNSAYHYATTYYSWTNAGQKLDELYHRIKYTPIKL